MKENHNKEPFKNNPYRQMKDLYLYVKVFYLYMFTHPDAVKHE